MKSLDISIIVPCLNEEKYIGETIRRIKNQNGAGDRFQWELLVVDGKSTDKTRTVINDEIQRHPGVKLVINENGTTPVAFNLGIQHSSGRYICILGAHAEIEDNYLINCLDTMDRVQADNVGGPCRAKGDGYVGEAIALAFQNRFAVESGQDNG